jgi:nucleotide-binding universal stress UspA family protein
MDSVVVGYEGRAQSQDALALAGLLASIWDARVMATWVDEQYEPYSTETRAWQRAHRERALELKAAAGGVLRAVPEWDLRAIQAKGAARGLHDVAKEESARALVVGSSHLGQIGQVAIGSTASRLLVDSPCPIAVAPAGWAASWADRRDTGPPTLAVGLDGCEECDGALAHARLLADGLHARLMALAVAPHPAPPGSNRERARAQAAELVDAQLERGDERSTERVVLGGAPAAALAAASREVDLLVVGCRSSGGMVGHLLRNVPRRLTRVAACPLFVVPGERVGTPA